MVEKGMGKGAVFMEGSSFYRVEEVLPDGNYVSRRISKEEAEKLLLNDSAPEESAEANAPSETVGKQTKRTGGRRAGARKTGQQKSR